MTLLALASETAPARRPAPRFKRVCPECGEPHLSVRRDADFCGDACRKSFNNRRLVRGAELYDLWMTLRHERGVAVAVGVWKILCRLSQLYREEDVREREGRKSWRSAKEVIARRPWITADNLAPRHNAGRRSPS